MPTHPFQVFPRILGILWLGLFGAFAGTCSAETIEIESDLLIVGGNESTCAAAVQAARLGVTRIVLVNDSHSGWLGGQFSAEGVGCLDEWTTVDGERTNFPRSGLFLEIVNPIRAHNEALYGVASPGNAYCGTEATFLNWPVQDYPLCQLPQRVIDALEATEAGASKKNIVEMTPAQRQIIFDDAKQHTLGMLYHLQTAVHDRVGDFPQSFRYMELTGFNTPDRLPPKPYIREGLRLEALTMLREQDIRTATREPKWAKVVPSDGVFGFQFNIDFHPTRRKFLTNDRNGPWQFVHTGTRNWHTDTDRAMFPLRGLVPIERDGLLGCGKNIGVSSIEWQATLQRVADAVRKSLPSEPPASRAAAVHPLMAAIRFENIPLAK